MKIIKEIQNVLDYVVTSNQCIILNDKKNLIEVYDDKFNKINEVESIESHREIFTVDLNKLVVKDQRAKIHFFDFIDSSLLKSTILTEKFKDYKFPVINELSKDDLNLGACFLLSQSDKETFTKKIFQVSINDNFSIKWNIESQGLKSINGNFYDHYITKYNGQNGDLLWRNDRINFTTSYIEDFNSREEVKEEYIRNLIGIHEGTIWVTLTSGRIIGFNDKFGKIEFTLSRESCDYSQIEINGDPKLPLYTVGLQLDKSSNKLFTFVGSTFVKLDLTDINLSIQYKNVLKSNDHQEMNVSMGKVSNIPFDEKNYYVIDNYKNQIGSINKSSLQFQEIISLGMNNGLIVDFRLYKNKIYVKNQDNSLKIISLI